MLTIYGRLSRMKIVHCYDVLISPFLLQLKFAFYMVQFVFLNCSPSPPIQPSILFNYSELTSHWLDCIVFISQGGEMIICLCYFSYAKVCFEPIFLGRLLQSYKHLELQNMSLLEILAIMDSAQQVRSRCWGITMQFMYLYDLKNKLQ